MARVSISGMRPTEVPKRRLIRADGRRCETVLLLKPHLQFSTSSYLSEALLRTPALPLTRIIPNLRKAPVSKSSASDLTMHLPTAVLAFAAFTTSVAALYDPNSSSHTDCTYDGSSGPDNTLDSATLATCLENYNQGGWDGTVCGARGWYKGGRLWDSAEDCYGSCHECISNAITNKWTNAKCTRSVSGATCWMGYN